MVPLKKSSSYPEKPPDCRPNVTSPSGGQLPVTSSVGLTRLSTSFLDDVTQTSGSSNISPPTRASTLDSFTGEIRPPGNATENTDGERAWTSSSPSSRSKMSRMSRLVNRGETYLKQFPPLIPSLGIGGRPRYSYKKVTGSDERLIMHMIKSTMPDLVHYTTLGDDGVSMVRKTVVTRDEESDDRENNREEMTGDPEKNKEEMTDDSEDNDGKEEEEMTGNRGKNKEVMTGDPEKNKEEMTGDRVKIMEGRRTKTRRIRRRGTRPEEERGEE